MTQTRHAPGIVSLLVRNDAYVSGPQVLSELRRVIASGQVAPGSPIPIQDVAVFFGVSLIPVREALKTLLGEGLLHHQPRLGYTVTNLSPAELAEIYLVRGALEFAAMEGAARNSTPEDHQLAQAIHTAMAEAVQDQDVVAFQRASREFHEALLAPSRMPRLLHMLEIAWNLTEPVQTMMRLSNAERVAMQKDHQEMLEAFIEHDVERLMAAARVHHDRLTVSIGQIPGHPA